MIRLERGDVIVEAAPAVSSRRGLEARQRQQRVAALEVLIDAFLQHRAEGLPDFPISLRLPVGEPFQLAEHAAGGAFPDRGKQRAFLDFFAGDVERQIGAVDQPANETQIARQDLCVVGDEDALDVKLDAALAVGIEQVERPRARNKQQCRVVLPPFGMEMDRQRRFVELAGDAAIKVGVIRGRDLGLRLRPQSSAVGNFGRLGAGLLDDRDRHRHVTRLGLDEALDGEALGVGLGVFHQIEHYAGTPARSLGRVRGRYGEGALAVGRPEPDGVRPGATGDHIDAVRDHERRIEADAESADQRGVLAAALLGF